jgi:hypothetical protein
MVTSGYSRIGIISRASGTYRAMKCIEHYSTYCYMRIRSPLQPSTLKVPTLVNKWSLDH